MKKFIAVVMTLAVALGLAACGNKVKVMSYAEYMAAELQTEVTVETYVQAKESWWSDKCTVYTQNKDGAVFLYDMPCTEEDYAKLVPGTKIRVTGVKAEWSGEVELTWDEGTKPGVFTIVKGDTYVADPTDVTSVMGTDDLIKHMNKKVCFKGMTVEAANEDGAAYLYKWDGSGEDGDDLYFNVSLNGNTYSFNVRKYLCGKDTEVYAAVKNLQVGDKIDLEGYLYWYADEPQPRITAVSAAQ